MRGATGIKFFALKRYLPAAAGGGGYLYSADYKGINSEQLDFSGRAASHSRGRSSRAHPEIRLPHEGAAQAEDGFCRSALFGNIPRNCIVAALDSLCVTSTHFSYDLQNLFFMLFH